jgi:hypothetical protein
MLQLRCNTDKPGTSLLGEIYVPNPIDNPTHKSKTRKKKGKQ